jgi:hypothetical protein
VIEQGLAENPLFCRGQKHGAVTNQGKNDNDNGYTPLNPLRFGDFLKLPESKGIKGCVLGRFCVQHVPDPYRKSFIL